MKFVAILAVALVAVAGADFAKRQFGEILLAAEPIISQLLISQTGLGKLINRFVGDIGGFVHGHTGHIPLEGTQLVIDYNSHRCTWHVGKRGAEKRLFGDKFGEHCVADACENKITKVCRSCTKTHQKDALPCALKALGEELQRLIKQAQAAHAKAG